jgi:hypothetical protein
MLESKCIKLARQHRNRHILKTNDIINNHSCHPREHKVSTYKSIIHRLHNLPLNKARKTNLLPLLSLIKGVIKNK